MDRPDQERKLHAWPTPNIGGVGIAVGLLGGVVCLLGLQAWMPFEMDLPPAGLWVGALVMVFAGIYDDLHGLDFKAKLGLQVVAAYLLLLSGYGIDVARLPFASADVYQQALFSIPVTVVWIVGVINAVNLIDGVDGLAGGVVLIAFASLAVMFGINGEMALVLVAIPVAGAVLGFLVYNFNPASVFMGDTGSLLLGFLLAAYSLEAQVHTDPVLALVIPVMALGLPVLDTGLSIVRRVAERKSIAAPDSDHIHHRMVRRWPVRTSVLMLYGISAGFGVVAILMTRLAFWPAVVLLALTLVFTVVWLRRLGYHLRRPPVVRHVEPEPYVLHLHEMGSLERRREPQHVVEEEARGADVGTLHVRKLHRAGT